MLDSTKRIIRIQGKEAAGCGGVTGPLTLAGHLAGDGLFENGPDGHVPDAVRLAGEICLALCRSNCELGTDAVVIAEELAGGLAPEECRRLLDAPLRSMRNVAAYYGARTILLGRRAAATDMDLLLSLGADGAALSGDSGFTAYEETARQQGRFHARCLPDAALLAGAEATGTASAACLDGMTPGCFLSTEWEVPLETNVDAIHRITDEIENRTMFPGGQR